ncbi:hypothetical protein [Mycolicibacterium neworleansense]|uniref:Uncharacterized protein n=1 Tax=Mycolicibacterium neworleansense TaxID=146018 RepID=A0A0H5RVL6_9MYCO|nr:hypothetical protein [Mycolicibacterium neworleansense]MCV7365482.1 hypothetical protein [Mycolicibacterium neworleansense]CRZ17978.1 hypothetical protein BN2156_04875 [Mycolicibacterium neworleansense]
MQIQYDVDATEVLATRLVLAHLAETEDETAFLSWMIQADARVGAEAFLLASHSARIAAQWWKRAGLADQARDMLVRRLTGLTTAA